MRRLSRTKLARLGELALPWLMGLFLASMAEEALARNATWSALGIAFLLSAVLGAGLRWRRRFPERVMVVELLAGLGYQLLVPEQVVPFAPLFALGALAAARPPQVSIPGLAGVVGLAAMNFFTTTVEDAVFTMGLAVAAWALGEAARSRRRAIREETARAVSEEHARISRELHDVIAHSVSVIVVQAAAADDVFDTRPDQARTALRSIEQSGRDALGELRRLLGAFRPGEEGDPAWPQPGLDRLDELAAIVRASGLRVSVRSKGSATPLPAGVDLSAYRIVQEALTNTLRHAHASSAEVTVRYGPEAVEVDVCDDGRGAPEDDRHPAGLGLGLGLVGMRERASLVGGRVEAGLLPRGGYRVHALLPLQAGR